MLHRKVISSKIIILDEGGMFRSEFARQMLLYKLLRVNNARYEAGEGCFDGEEFPTVLCGGLWRTKVPKYDRLTDYPLWQADRERFEQLAVQFGGGWQ